MNNNQKHNTMTALKIGTLVSKLTPSNQAYLLNMINALLLSQQTANQNHTAKKERE